MHLPRPGPREEGPAGSGHEGSDRPRRHPQAVPALGMAGRGQGAPAGRPLAASRPGRGGDAGSQGRTSVWLRRRSLTLRAGPSASCHLTRKRHSAPGDARGSMSVDSVAWPGPGLSGKQGRKSGAECDAAERFVSCPDAIRRGAQKNVFGRNDGKRPTCARLAPHTALGLERDVVPAVPGHLSLEGIGVEGSPHHDIVFGAICLCHLIERTSDA